MYSFLAILQPKWYIRIPAILQPNIFILAILQPKWCIRIPAILQPSRIFFMRIRGNAYTALPGTMKKWVFHVFPTELQHELN